MGGDLVAELIGSLAILVVLIQGAVAEQQVPVGFEAPAEQQ